MENNVRRPLVAGRPLSGADLHYNNSQQKSLQC